MIPSTDGHPLVRHAAFVISLERATQRLAHARTLLTQISLPAEILPAVDGNAMSAEEISAVYQRVVHKPRYPAGLRTGEIGCFLSHRAAWRMIVERDLDAALILEDDVRINQDQLAASIELLMTDCPDEAYVQFPVRRLPKAVRQVARGPRCRLVCPQVTPLRTSGQWVSRAAARRLLNCTQVFDRPVDTFLQMHWITGLRLLAIEPSGLSDLTAELGTTIGTDKPGRLSFERISNNLSRAVNRSWYRWQIAQLSERRAG